MKTTLAEIDGRRTRVEHLMVYDLAGWISPWLQNTVSRSGHVGAYLHEWRNLVRHACVQLVRPELTSRSGNVVRERGTRQGAAQPPSAADRASRGD